jgi:hypothetical protein
MASTGLSKTFSSSPTNNKKGTISLWMKRSALGSCQIGPSVAGAGGGNCGLQIDNNDKLYMYLAYVGGTWYGEFLTNRKFRDINAWYHIVIAWDTTQSTSTDRMKLYVNGVQETSLATANYPDQDRVTTFGNATAHYINYWNNGAYFDGVMSHLHYTDGYTYAASDFGETDSTTGEWKIKTNPNVTYGNNGYFILKDGNSVTDQSGQSNNWTVATGTLTKTEDCPSNVFATLNPLADYHANITFSYGNNKTVSPGDRHDFAVSTLGMNVGSGKFYAEFKLVAAAGSDHCVVGISDHNYMGNNEELSQENYSIAYVNGGTLRSSGTNAATGVGTYTAGDIIGVAVDMENLKIYWHKNGTYVNSGDPTSGSTGTGAVSIHNINTSPNSSSRGQGNYFLAVGNWHSGAASTWEANFGNGYFGTTAVSSAGTNASNNGIFEYDVPSGYTALSTKGLNL